MKSGKPQTLKEILKPKKLDVIQRRDPNGNRYENFSRYENYPNSR